MPKSIRTPASALAFSISDAGASSSQEMSLVERCVDRSGGVHMLLSHVRLFATLWTVARQAPLSKGILQARILEWVVIPFSRGSSQPRD